MTIVDCRPIIRFPTAGRDRSILSVTEKFAHFREIEETAARDAGDRDEISAKVNPYRAWERPVVPPAL